MRKLISWCGFSVILLFVNPLYSQSAQEVIDIAFKNYGEMSSYSGVITSRSAYIATYPTPEGTAPRYDVQNIRFTQIDTKWRKPGDWLLLRTANYGAAAGATPTVQFSALSRVNNGPVMQNSYHTSKSVAQSSPGTASTPILRGFIALASTPLVLNQFLGPLDDSSNIAWGVVEPEFKADELCQSELCYQINGRTTSGQFIALWISKSHFLLLRSLTVNSGASSPRINPNFLPPNQRINFPQETTGAARSGRRLVVDTLLMDQQINPPLSASVFSLPATGSFDPTVGERTGFSDFAAVVKLMPPAAVPANSENAPETVAGISSGSGFGGAPVAGGTPGAVTAPVAPTPAPTPNSDPASTGQLLTPTQMSGIILIDGDESTGSGFMTKIKGVDFVVTNLHVVGGNKKFTLKTLRGVEVPVLGIFGAVGSDIAILRVGKGEGDLKLAEDVFSSAKIGDRVVVVGNRLGGGVATQTPGNIVGIGPTRVEVSANFESGNSGSPIVDLNTGEVIGIATYSETRRVDVEDATDDRRSKRATPATVEKRWFGYRVDAVSKWESIDLVKWKAQGDRIDKFRGLSEALVAFLKLDFRTARQHPRLTGIMESFEGRYRASAGNSISAATEVKDLFRTVRSISSDGVNDLTNGEYYDYYRTCLYWENSITSQLEYRKAIIEALKKYEANSSGYVSRMRNGG